MKNLAPLGTELLQRVKTLHEEVRIFLIEAKGGTDWASYKRDQRSQAYQDHYANLRHYHELLRNKKAYLAALQDQQDFFKHNKLSDSHCFHGITCGGEFCEVSGQASLDSMTLLSGLVAPFSPLAKQKAERETLFAKLAESNPADRLPWKHILIEHTQKPTEFKHLPQYVPEHIHRRAQAKKLAELLQMENDGWITLSQDEAFGSITITPNHSQTSHEQLEAQITITKKDGRTLSGNWLDLTDSARTQIIEDARKGEIYCR